VVIRQNQEIGMNKGQKGPNFLMFFDTQNIQSREIEMKKYKVILFYFYGLPSMFL
jgi:hypothetical protein